MKLHAKDVISSVPPDAFAPELAADLAIYRFDIAGAGTWCVICDHGSVRFVEGPGEADTTLACDEQDFVDMIRGKRRLITAVLQGRVKVSGDVARAIQLGGVLARAASPRRDAEVSR